ncbi:hypothetical protein CRE_05274 [Caenorhabditis remanei]|uniref:RING-type domain-containing protein n=1 Tax=Caenorhabditis remanei TaxID=31234 RepID=E3NK45_CAERE|nr:hypothetical protein CRE_05274 [Caenorhabditis remanei]
MAIEPPKPTSVTDSIVIALTAITSILATVGIIYLIFAPVVPANFISAGAILATFLLIFGVLGLVKWVMDYCHVKYEIGRLDRVRHEMTVGLVGVLTCLTIPRVAIYFALDDYHTVCYLLIVSLSTACTFHWLFNYGFNQWCKINYRPDNEEDPIAALIIIFTFLLIGIDIRINVIFVNEDLLPEFLVFSILQILLAFFSGFVSYDLFMVLDGDLMLAGRVKQPLKETYQNTCTHSIIPFFSMIFGIFSMAFVGFTVTNYFPTVDWIIFFVTIGASLAAVLTLWGFKRIVVFINKKLGAKIRTMCQSEAFIGFTGIMICGFVPRVVVFFVGFDVAILSFTIILSSVAALTFFFLFITWNGRRLDTKNNGWLIFIVFVINVIIFIGSIRFAVSYEDGKDIEVIIWTQFFFSFLTIPSMMDLGIILIGNGMIMNNENEEEIKMSSVKVQKSKKTAGNSSGPECKICLLPFNPSTVIPKILKECGHTVCGECADKLYGKQKQYRIICPICQKATVVIGGAKYLPKNFELLELI